MLFVMQAIGFFWMTAVLFVTLAGLLAVTIFALFEAARERRRLENAWRHAAERRGGVFSKGIGAIGGLPHIEVEENEVAVIVEASVRNGRGARGYSTGARAMTLIARGPAFRVDRLSPLALLGRVLGFGCNRLSSDPSFDAWFSVQTNDRQATRDMLTPRAMHLLRMRFPEGSLHCDGKTIRLTWNGLERDSTRLDAAIELMTELARFGISVLDPIRALPHARYLAPRGPWSARTSPSVQLPTPAGEVRVEPIVHERQLTLRGSAQSRSDLPTFHARLHNRGEIDGELPKAMVGLEAASQLERAGNGELRCDGRTVSLEWDPIPSPEEVFAGARLLGSLAGGSVSQGAFR